MKLHTQHILKISTIMCGIFFFFVSCGSTSPVVPEPEVDPPGKEEDPPEPPKPPVYDDGPYEYDYDLDFDFAAFVSAYKGTPYGGGAHAVPGVIEAEDFDEGSDGVAYHDDGEGGKVAQGYRAGHAVDIRPSGNASNGYYVGEMGNSEWMSYSIDVAQDGAYSIDVYVVNGNDANGSFYFEVDGYGACKPAVIPKGNGWEDFQKSTATDVQLSKGKHILRYRTTAAGNVDRFEFTRTGEMKDLSNAFNYPQTKTFSGNPLFTEFGSPMYNSPMIGNLYTADPSAHVWNIDGKEVLYVYASHDMEPAQGCDRMDRYHVFSTEDMVNWTDHGEIMNSATVQLQNGWGCEGFMWAPDCAYNPETKLYYFYFPHPTSAANWNTTWKIGVATSPYPDKEFRVRGYVEGMSTHIDPCVFVDDDGQAYIYNGGGGRMFGGKLSKYDWTKLDGTMQTMTGMDDFHEGAWVYKRNGIYYLTYADNKNGANQLRYATSNSPLGPWTSQGVYLESTTCDTSHGSVVEFKGQSYQFYHCSDVSGQGVLRSVCVDKLNYNSDGTIQVVKQTRAK